MYVCIFSVLITGFHCNITLFVVVYLLLLHPALFVTLCTIDHQALLSMGFPRQEYCLGIPPSRDSPDPGSEPMSPALAGNSILLSHQGSPHFILGI